MKAPQSSCSELRQNPSLESWRSPPALIPGQAHIWHCTVDERRDSGLLASYAGTLDSTESQRLQRLRFAADKHRFLLSHALLRSLLSLYGGESPQAWRFQRGEYGKPALIAAQASRMPQFNMSHSADAVLIVIAAGQEMLGVDVEYHRAGRRVEQMSRRKFAAIECQQLQACSLSRRAARFYDLWALKESFIKARGEGLALSLQSFAFCFETQQHYEFVPDPMLGERAADWRFWSYRMSAGYSAALAWKTGSDLPLMEPLWVDAIPFSGWSRRALAPGTGNGRITAI